MTDKDQNGSAPANGAPPDLTAVNPEATAVPGSAAEAGGSLAEELATAQARAAEFQDAFLRAKADAENIRRRGQEEVAKAHKFAVESFAESMLPVADSLEAALAADHPAVDALRSGVELTLRQLNAAFERNKLAVISPAGQKFDPNLHQAISMQPSDLPAQTVVSVLQKGYTIADRVLRPALVTVSQGPAGNPGNSAGNPVATPAGW